MSVRFIKGFLNALSMFILGAALMGRWYCVHLDITSGPMFLDWVSIGVMTAGLIGIHIIVWFDPSFKEEEVSPAKRVIRVVSLGKRK